MSEFVNKYLNPFEFVNWLENFPKKGTLPSVNYITRCPIAVFLKSQDSSFEDVAIYSEIYDIVDSNSVQHIDALPEWAIAFIAKGVEYLGSPFSREDIPVSACLKIMEDLDYFTIEVV